MILYLANPCGPASVNAMRSGAIGLIDTPRQRKRTQTDHAHDGDAIWCADNGCFSDKWDEATWWQFLLDNQHRAATCLFAVAPDIVGDAWRSHMRSQPWLRKIQQLGYPVAYVAQDGAEKWPIPWLEFDVLFIGGTTTWKLGPHAREIAAEAKRRGKWVHMGRVNSERRYEYARAIGCDSADGTYLTFGPDTNLPKLLAWTRNNAQDGLFGVTP